MSQVPGKGVGPQSQKRTPPQVSVPTKSAAGKGPAARVAVRPRRKTPEEEYDMTSHGDTFGGSRANRCLVREEASKLMVVRPSWEGDMPLVFKPFPAIDPHSCEDWLPGRKSADDNAFTDWFRVMPAIKYVGVVEDASLTCLTYDKRWLKKGYNPATDNPYFILHKALMGATQLNQRPDRKGKSEPQAMLNGRNVMTMQWVTAAKSLCSPSLHFGYMQGCVFQSDREVFVAGKQPPLGFRDGDRPVIIELQSNSPINGLKKLLNERVEGAAISEDPAEQFTLGDPVDPQTGPLFCVYNPDKSQRQYDGMLFATGQGQGAADAVEDASMDEDIAYADPGDEGEKKGRPAGYEVVATRELIYLNKFKQKKRAVCDISAYDDAMRGNYQWWDDILYVPETPELALWLARSFATLPSLLLFCWQDNPEFLTDEVKGVLNARKIIPGASPPSSRAKRNATPTAAADDDDVDVVTDELDAEAEAVFGDAAAEATDFDTGEDFGGIEDVDHYEDDVNAVAEEDVPLPDDMVAAEEDDVSGFDPEPETTPPPSRQRFLPGFGPGGKPPAGKAAAPPKPPAVPVKPPARPVAKPKR